MIARRFALASLVAVGTLAVAGCGMMDRDKGGAGVMSVPLSGKNEVPPNASTGSGTAPVELDGNVIKWNVTSSGTTGPVTAGHFHGPAAPGSNAGVVVPFTGPLASPIIGQATLTPA
ncbi:MAG: CHRD domain-containing protein, partial [Rhizobacter sp.]|nr:CHRD domain-containing protein [Rhizobacter sp.]